jgi:hypothetical protein
LYPSFLDDFHTHTKGLKLDVPKKLRQLKSRFVLLDLLSERTMQPEDFNTLAQAILAEQKDVGKVLGVHLPSAASGSPSRAATFGWFFNWIPVWGPEPDPVLQQKLIELPPSEIMKIVGEQSALITDSEFLSRLHDYATRIPALQQLALEAKECGRSYLAKLVTHSTTKLMHRARCLQKQECSHRARREAINKEKEELKTSRCQWIDEITEASRASPSCVIQLPRARPCFSKSP